MTADERKVLGFCALLLTLSAAARWMNRPPDVVTDAPVLDVPALMRQDSALRAGREGREGAPAQAPLQAEKVDPNRADAAALERLPGVGAATAAAIIAARDTGGPFRTADDLLRVRGIGPAKLAAMREHLSLP